jgi:hypothetical protein
MKYIIIVVNTKKALYGFGGITLQFSSNLIANEFAVQFFEKEQDFIIVPIKTK